MTENDYITALKARWPQDCDAPLQTIAFADEAIRAFPESARLWCIRGNRLELGAKSYPDSLDDALACYQRAVDIDPEFAEAWEALGHLHHVVLDNEAAAKRFFREAERLRRVTNEERIAAPLLALLVSGGTMERTVSDLPA